MMPDGQTTQVLRLFVAPAHQKGQISRSDDLGVQRVRIHVARVAWPISCDVSLAPDRDVD